MRTRCHLTVNLLSNIAMQPICSFLCTTHTGPKKTHHITRCKLTRKQPTSRRERSNPNHPSLSRRTCGVNFRTVHRITNLVVRHLIARSEVTQSKEFHRHPGESARNFCTCKPRCPLAEEMTPTSSHKRRMPSSDQNSG